MSKYNMNLEDAKKAAEPVPTAVYSFVIVDVEEKKGGPTSKAPGALQLSLELEINKGEYAGRKLFKLVQLPDALRDKTGQQAAERSLGQFLIAVGHTGTDGFDTDDFIGCEVLAGVDVEDTEEYGKRNVVKGLRAA